MLKNCWTIISVGAGGRCGDECAVLSLVLQTWERSDLQRHSACQQESVSNQTNHLYEKGNLCHISNAISTAQNVFVLFSPCKRSLQKSPRLQEAMKEPHALRPRTALPPVLQEDDTAQRAVSTPAQHLMAAINIHCCRWVFIAINSLINECKLRTSWLRGCVAVLLAWG